MGFTSGFGREYLNNVSGIMLVLELAHQFFDLRLLGTSAKFKERGMIVYCMRIYVNLIIISLIVFSCAFNLNLRNIEISRALKHDWVAAHRRRSRMG